MFDYSKPIVLEQFIRTGEEAVQFYKVSQSLRRLNRKQRQLDIYKSHSNLIQ